jgi:pyridoxal 5'-phosphate synthase pdxT subunit
LRIGVLAFQGSIVEHMKVLSKIDGVLPSEVRIRSELNTVNGLILPGGESTTIAKLLNEYALLEPLINMIKDGMPVWGTCAGMILMAKSIINEQKIHLGVMDISVRRNAYGSQLDSFYTCSYIQDVSENVIPLVFIRAPWVEEVQHGVKVMAKLNGKIIAARQDNMLVTSFHPELTEDISFHRYFVNMVQATKYR